MQSLDIGIRRDSGWRQVWGLVRLGAKFLGRYRLGLTCVLLLQIAAAAGALYLPRLNADLIDNGVLQGDTSYIWRAGGVMLAAIALQLAAMAGATFVGTRLALTAARDLRAAIVRHIHGLSTPEVDRFGAASLVTRTTTDVQQVQAMMLLGQTVLVRAPIMLLGGISMALHERIALAVPLLGVLILLPAVAWLIKGIVPGFAELEARRDRLNRIVREQLTGSRVIRAFVREAHETARFGAANKGLTDAAIRVGRLTSLTVPMVTLAGNLTGLVVIGLGDRMARHGTVELGSVVAMLGYSAFAFTSLLILAMFSSYVPQAAACADRIRQVLATTSSVRPPGTPRPFNRDSGVLELHAVEFRYPGAESPVLSGIDLRCSPGEVVAIVGSTGSGKTALANLITRLADPTDGQIRLGGTDIRDINIDLLRATVGLVPQESRLLSGTIADNLRSGAPDATAAELWRALETAQLADLVRSLPGGLQAPVGQGGATLSGGQRQRLAIARTLVAQPRVFVFDDAFSALDHTTEARLRAALADVTAAASVIVIAQRLSTVETADRIVVLDGGRIVGSGRHQELLETSPTYREFVASQRNIDNASAHESTPIENVELRADDLAVASPPAVESAPDTQRSGRTVLRVLRLFAPDRYSYLGVVLLGLVALALNLLGPALIGSAIDQIYGAVLAARANASSVGSTQVLSPLALAAAVFVAAAIAGWLQGRALNALIARTIARVRTEIEAKIHRLPIRYFDTEPRGELLSRATNDVETLSQSLQQLLGDLVTAVLTLVVAIALMLWISPSVTVVAVLAVPVAAALTAAIGRRSKPHFAALAARTGQLTTQVEEHYTAHEVISIFRMGRRIGAEFEQSNARVYSSATRAQFISGLITPIITFAGNLNYVAIAIVGGVKVATGTMSLGDVQAFIMYSNRCIQPLTEIGPSTTQFQSGMASARRIFELLDAEEESPDTAYPISVPTAPGRVQFRDVCFGYNSAAPVLNRLTLTAPPGATVAIVGPTGAGKTTLVNLIERFYEPDSGSILIDGIDIATLPRSLLRAQIGVVLQDIWLFHGTIWDNIAYGNPAASEADILAAARAAYVDRFVHRLPDGYRTVLNDDGSGISQGEKQLVTIARAFLAQPGMLVLDEATSRVDTRTELQVQRAMAALRRHRTSFVIAHRLSTIRAADLIVVLHNGQIIEQGTHDQLIRDGGMYRRMYSDQFVDDVMV